MNSYAIVFVALIAAAAASSVHRETGWGAPAIPTINLELAGALAVNGQGQADAQQQLAESAHGDADVPANIASVSGISASAIQEGEIQQVATADLTNGNTQTFQEISAAQDVAGFDSVVADLSGAYDAAAAVSAATSASGSGDLAIAGTSVNSVTHS